LLDIFHCRQGKYRIRHGQNVQRAYDLNARIDDRNARIASSSM
jgi:hypothetical protein